MNQPQRIFIMGHHGAGKALLAKNLAQSLGWRFVDADLGLESHIGRHLHEILGEQGTDAFYNSQFDILTSLCTQENIVVSTDSSVTCSEKNRQLLQTEVTVFLDVSTPVQMTRISRNAENLLPIANLSHFFEQLHEERDGLYKQVAKLTIQGDDGKLENHTQYIIKTLWGETPSPSKNLKATLEKKDLALFHKELYTKIDLTAQQALYLKLLAQGNPPKKLLGRFMYLIERSKALLPN
jgi:shikimate kinase